MGMLSRENGPDVLWQQQKEGSLGVHEEHYVRTDVITRAGLLTVLGVAWWGHQSQRVSSDS